MTASFPASLVGTEVIPGLKETAPDRLLRSEMDAGKAKQRPRYVAAARPIEVTFALDAAQTDTLDDFFEITLNQALPFTYTHPRTQATVTYRFKKPPEYVPDGESTAYWLAKCSLEIV